jgi:hypothetical protein
VPYANIGKILRYYNISSIYQKHILQRSSLAKEILYCNDNGYLSIDLDTKNIIIAKPQYEKKIKENQESVK